MKEEEGKGVSIDDFIITQKVDAFCGTYIHEEEEKSADEVFTDTKLRKYFQAYPRNIGDPLAGYLDMLVNNNGFKMQTSITGEPALFVKRLDKTERLMLEDTFGE